MDMNRLFKECERLNEKYLSFLIDICNISSKSDDKAGVDAVCKYCADFARKMDYEVKVEQINGSGNVMSATLNPNAEGEPVCMSAHMDTVVPGSGIEPVVEDGVIRSKGNTVLGSDDKSGIVAVVEAMRTIVEHNLPHPTLQAVFTVCEEIGLLGAAAVDMSAMKGRTLINLDSEGEGVFTVSCAGGCTATISLPVERRAVYGPCIRLAVDGLQGGHSGADIHLNRGNANKIMGEFMNRIQKLMPLCLTSLSGGAKDNAIPRSCQATLVAMGIHLDRINAIAEQLQAEVREQYNEPEATVQAFDVDALGGNSLSTESTAKVISLLCAAPNSVQTWSKDIEGLVQTSLNMGVVKLGDRLNVTLSVRSSVNTEKQELLDQLKRLAEMFDASYTEAGAYPAWEYKKESRLRDVMVSTYREMFGKEAKVEAIHAGLECGLFTEKLPGLDCVSIGPQMHDIHTSRERLEIASTQRTWDFLLAVLKNL